MTGTAECLQVAPNKVLFSVQAGELAKASITLQNPTDARIAFKVKTTSPQSYSVKPTAGVLEPGGTARLAVSMAAPSLMKLPATLTHCKDRFLVKAMVVGPDVQQANSDLFKANPKLISGTKLRVVVLKKTGGDTGVPSAPAPAALQTATGIKTSSTPVAPVAAAKPPVQAAVKASTMVPAVQPAPQHKQKPQQQGKTSVPAPATTKAPPPNGFPCLPGIGRLVKATTTPQEAAVIAMFQTTIAAPAAAAEEVDGTGEDAAAAPADVPPSATAKKAAPMPKPAVPVAKPDLAKYSFSLRKKMAKLEQQQQQAARQQGSAAKAGMAAVAASAPAAAVAVVTLAAAPAAEGKLEARYHMLAGKKHVDYEELQRTLVVKPTSKAQQAQQLGALAADQAEGKAEGQASGPADDDLAEEEGQEEEEEEQQQRRRQVPSPTDSAMVSNHTELAPAGAAEDTAATGTPKRAVVVAQVATADPTIATGWQVGQDGMSNMPGQVQPAASGSAATEGANPQARPVLKAAAAAAAVGMAGETAAVAPLEAAVPASKRPRFPSKVKQTANAAAAASGGETGGVRIKREPQPVQQRGGLAEASDLIDLLSDSDVDFQQQRKQRQQPHPRTKAEAGAALPTLHLSFHTTAAAASPGAGARQRLAVVHVRSCVPLQHVMAEVAARCLAGGGEADVGRLAFFLGKLQLAPEHTVWQAGLQDGDCIDVAIAS